MAHLRSTGKVTKIGLWGRSMGAATSLFYGQKDPSVAALVLDSPFRCRRKNPAQNPMPCVRGRFPIVR